MGCVYLAEQQLGSTARKVALKTLHKHLSHDPQFQARFDCEAGTVAGLEHPNTIQVFDYGKMEDGTLFIVMEYVQGRSVADILEKDGPMDSPRVANIMKQVCGSLEEAHGHGIIHRDLKPDNVVLCERAGQKDWVKVLDFGIAKRSSENDPNEAKLTQQGMVLGTPPYMSPEQFTGQPIDARSDIYALGVMAYEMLTGKLPFDANTAWEWASKHMTEPPTPMERQPLGPNVPPGMRAAIMKALAKNKDERFTNARAFAEAFASTDAPVSSEVGHAKTEAVAQVDMPVSTGRAKTEMAQPVMGGAGTPPFGSTPGVVASVPQAPVHSPAKKGGNGLVIGLAIAAVLLLGGGALAFMSSSKKPQAVDPVSATLNGLTPSASVTVATPDPTTPTPDPSVDVGDTKPLDPGKPAKVEPAGNAGGGTTTKKPPPAKPEPEVCNKAKAEKAKGSPAAVVNALENACRSQGGKI